MENNSWIYDAKCRTCGKITRMFHSRRDQISANSFKTWVQGHSTFPIEKKCDCDAEMMHFHDIVSYGKMIKTITNPS
jgi:hypothetical protein